MTTLATPTGFRTVSRSGAELTAPSNDYSGGGHIPLIRRNYGAATYEEMYKHQLWVYVVVNKLQKAIARLPWKTYRWLDAEGEQVERVRDHPLVNLLSRPWPTAAGYQLKEAVVGSLGVHGNAVLYKVRPGPGQPPSQLWFLPQRNLETVHDGRLVDYYIFHGPTARVAILPEDVVHYRLWGLGKPVGISPLEPLAKTLMLEDAAQEFSAGYFRNSATPRTVFSTAKKLRKDDIEVMREQLQRLYGGTEKAGNFAVLGDETKVTTMSHNLVDTDLIRQRQLNREEVAAAYDMAPPLVGILDRATFSNITELHLALYTDTLPPWLDLLESVTHVQLRDPEPEFQGVFTEFDLRDVLKGDIDKRSSAYQRFQQSGVYAANELRRLENLPPIGDPKDPANPANQVLMPLNMAPLGASTEEIEARSRVLSLFQMPGSNGHGEVRTEV